MSNLSVCIAWIHAILVASRLTAFRLFARSQETRRRQNKRDEVRDGGFHSWLSECTLSDIGILTSSFFSSCGLPVPIDLTSLRRGLTRSRSHSHTHRRPYGRRSRPTSPRSAVVLDPPSLVLLEAVLPLAPQARAAVNNSKVEQQQGPSLLYALPPLSLYLSISA